MKPSFVPGLSRLRRLAALVACWSCALAAGHVPPPGEALATDGPLAADGPLATNHVAEESARLSLDQCLELAVTGSSELRASREQATAAAARAAAARAERWPRLSLGIDTRYVSDVAAIIQPGEPPRGIRLGDNDTYEAHTGLDLPLYTGGTLTAEVQAHRAEAEAARFDLAADSLRLVRDVRATFYGALGAEASAEAATLAAARIARRIEEIDRQIEAGAATMETRLLAESRLRSAEQRALRAEDALQTARLELGRVIGLPERAITPAGSLEAPLLGDPASGRETERPELQASRLRELAGLHLHAATAGRLRPQLAAHARLHYGRPGVRIVEDEWMEWFSAGLELRWTLWDGGARTRRVEEAAALADARVARSHALEERLRTSLAVARAHVERKDAEAAKARERTELEAVRLTLVEGRHEEGWATETELLDAEDDRAEAEFALATSLAELRVAEADLLQALAR